MRISEKLSILKQKDGKMNRLYALRQTVLTKNFESTIINKENITEAELKIKREEFNKTKLERYKKINEEIKELKEEIITSRNLLNKKNVEGGIDEKLIRIKYLRIELSKLMSDLKREKYSFEDNIDLDDYERLDLGKEISELEGEKAKLDADIQKFNFENEV